MVYVYKKRIGNKQYYYLRASVKKDNKLITKDIAYLGNDASALRQKLETIPAEYKKDIRKAYATLNRFIEANSYLEVIKAKKLKKEAFLSKEDQERVGACRLHWETVALKRHELTKEEYLKNFIVEFAFNTTSLEGNTITLKEAHRLLVEKRTPKNKSLREIFDLQNTEDVFFGLCTVKTRLSKEFICKIHDDLLKNIDDRIGYRTDNIRVFRSKFKATPFQYIDEDMKILLKWYYEHQKKIHPVALAIMFHHKFEKIHPFFDGNGRTGRMLLNYLLMRDGHPPLIHKKKNRTTYLNQLSKADGCGLNEAKQGDYEGLINFSIKEYYEMYWNLFL